MSDMGDDFRAMREFKRDARQLWVECPSPGCDFGGNPVKVAPGSKCRHCGWMAPGERGSDVALARQKEKERWRAEEAAADRKARTQAERTCPQCGKNLRTKAGMLQHVKDKHGAAEPGVAA